MNIVEKILARGAGKSSVAPDDVVFAKSGKTVNCIIFQIFLFFFIVVNNWNILEIKNGIKRNR